MCFWWLERRYALSILFATRRFSSGQMDENCLCGDDFNVESNWAWTWWGTDFLTFGDHFQHFKFPSLGSSSWQEWYPPPCAHAALTPPHVSCIAGRLGWVVEAGGFDKGLIRQHWQGEATCRRCRTESCVVLGYETRDRNCLHVAEAFSEKFRKRWLRLPACESGGKPSAVLCRSNEQRSGGCAQC